MPLTREEITEIATRTADEVIERMRGIPELAFHTAEHVVRGSALMVNPAVAKDPGVPAKCFPYDTEEYCWKPGYIGLISSKKNPEQYATCVIKEPAGAGVARRFREIKGAVSEAHEEWEREEDKGLREWWQKVGEKLSEKGLQL